MTMYAKWITILAAGVVMFSAADASAAESYGLPNEQLVSFKGKVVDVACEITMVCPPRCGDGKHLLAVRTFEGKLFLAAKSNVDFMGVILDLLPSCGRMITVDGITTTNYGTTLLMVQRYKPADAAPWRDTNQSLVEWARANHVTVDSEEAKAWERNDSVVKAAVAKKGRLGVPE
jgi:hypothetical protein